jgi:hypothetical protein
MTTQRMKTMEDDLTFAEISCIAADAPGWGDVQTLLDLPASADGVQAAGASSLMVRGLARLENGKLGIREDVAAKVALLFRPSKPVWMSRSDGSGLNAAVALVPDSGEATCVASVSAPGVYSIDPLKPTQDPALQLRDLVMALAKDGRTAMTLGSKEAPNELLLGHDGESWTIGRSLDEAGDHQKTDSEETVAAMVEERIRAWVKA